MQKYIECILSKSLPETQYIFNIISNALNTRTIAEPDEAVVFEELRRHKLLPIFTECLKTNKKQIILGHLKERIDNQINRINIRMLSMLFQMDSIRDKLHEHKIFHVFLKGPVLCWQIHNNLHYRDSVDIDLYIQRQDLIRVDKYLQTLGYKRIKPKKCSRLIINFRNYLIKDWTYFHPEKKTAIELHFRLFPNVSNAKTERKLVQENNKQIEIQGKSFSVLSDELNFLFLCSHGSIHQWFRLMWLYDIYSIIEKQALILNWELLLSYSKKLKNKYSLVQAIKLCEIIFDIQVPEIIEKEYSKNRKRNDYLLKKALEAIILPINETVSRRIDRLIYLAKLQNGWGYKFHTFFSGVLRFMVGKA